MGIEAEGNLRIGVRDKKQSGNIRMGVGTQPCTNATWTHGWEIHILHDIGQGRHVQYKTYVQCS